MKSCVMQDRDSKALMHTVMAPCLCVLTDEHSLQVTWVLPEHVTTDPKHVDKAPFLVIGIDFACTQNFSVFCLDFKPFFSFAGDHRLDESSSVPSARGKQYWESEVSGV